MAADIALDFMKLSILNLSISMGMIHYLQSSWKMAPMQLCPMMTVIFARGFRNANRIQCIRRQ